MELRRRRAGNNRAPQAQEEQGRAGVRRRGRRRDGAVVAGTCTFTASGASTGRRHTQARGPLAACLAKKAAVRSGCRFTAPAATGLCHPRRPRRQWTGGGRSGCKDALPRQVRRYFATLMAAAARGTNSGNGADAGRPEKDDAGQGGRGWPREEKACDDVVQGRTADPQAERRARPPGPVRSLGRGLSVHQGG